MKVESVGLEGDQVRLESLELKHIEDFQGFCFNEEIWRWFPFGVTNLDHITAYVEDGIRNRTAGIEIPFATIDRATNSVVGSTRFMNIDVENLRAEIGSTWINPEWQGTYVNTEAKFLMLTHAFEVWKCIRVEFKTDARNEQSRRAILRLGAKEEGIHRQHMITESKGLRDSVFFSILDSEWVDVKRRLMAKLDQNCG